MCAAPLCEFLITGTPISVTTTVRHKATKTRQHEKYTKTARLIIYNGFYGTEVG